MHNLGSTLEPGDVLDRPASLSVTAVGGEAQYWPIASLGYQKFFVEKHGEKRWTPLQSSHDLYRPDPSVKQVIIAVHGMGRNVNFQKVGVSRNAGSYRVAHQLAVNAKLPTTAIALQLLANVDDRNGVLWNDGAVINDVEGWKGGYPSLRREGNFYVMDPRCIGSFEMVDQLGSHLLSIYENLERVVLFGHSAGAQFAQGYTAFGNAPKILKARDVQMAVGVANASSFGVLTEHRGKSLGDIMDFAERYGHELGINIDFSDDEIARILQWRRGPVIPPGEEALLPFLKSDPALGIHQLLDTELYVIAGRKDVMPNTQGVQTDLASLSQGTFTGLGPRNCPQDFGRYARAMHFEEWLMEMALRRGTIRQGGIIEVDAGHSGLSVVSTRSIQEALFGGSELVRDETGCSMRPFVPKNLGPELEFSVNRAMGGLQ